MRFSKVLQYLFFSLMVNFFLFHSLPEKAASFCDFMNHEYEVWI